MLSLIDRLLSEGKEIIKAPLVFGIASLIIGILIWTFFSWFYSNRLQSRDAAITELQATNQMKEERITLTRLKMDELQNTLESYKSTAEHLSSSRSGDSGAAPQRIETELALQFHNDGGTPTALVLKNILGWYVVWTPSASIDLENAQGKITPAGRIPKTWIVVMVFEKPTKLSQLVISASCRDMPPYEVKWATTSFAIVTISGDIPACLLNLNAHFVN